MAGIAPPRTIARMALAVWVAAAGAAAAQAGTEPGGMPPAEALPVLREAAVPSPKAVHAAMLAVARAGARLVAVGERGTVLLSDDDGATWRQAERVPVQASLTAVRFVDERIGWAVGHLGVILKTEDGGESWVLKLDGIQAAAALAEHLVATGDERAQRAARRLIHEGPDKPFFDVVFTDAQTGFVVGAFNMAFRTEDGGDTWIPFSARLPNRTSLHLYAVGGQGGSLFIAGEQGLLLQSSDNGKSFHVLASPYEGSFFGLLATRSGTLLAYGLRGNVFRSTDLGANWQPVESSVPVSISAATELPDGALALLAQTGDILVSRDDGLTFEKLPAAAPVPAAGLAATPNGALILASLRGLRRQPAP